MAPDGEAETSMTLSAGCTTTPAIPTPGGCSSSCIGPGSAAWCFTWGLQASDAEDVVQDVLVKLFAAMSKFQYDPAQLSSMAEDGDETRLVRFPRRPAARTLAVERARSIRSRIQPTLNPTWSAISRTRPTPS